MTTVYALLIWAAVLTVGAIIVSTLLIMSDRTQLEISNLQAEAIESLNRSYLDLATAHDILIKEHAALVRDVRAIEQGMRRTYRDLDSTMVLRRSGTSR